MGSLLPIQSQYFKIKIHYTWPSDDYWSRGICINDSSVLTRQYVQFHPLELEHCVTIPQNGCISK